MAAASAWGFSQHSGVVICADGTPEAAKRLERVLWNDPASAASGVMPMRAIRMRWIAPANMGCACRASWADHDAFGAATDDPSHLNRYLERRPSNG
jgi:hypothetical protein